MLTIHRTFVVLSQQAGDRGRHPVGTVGSRDTLDDAKALLLATIQRGVKFELMRHGRHGKVTIRDGTEFRVFIKRRRSDSDLVERNVDRLARAAGGSGRSKSKAAKPRASTRRGTR